MARGPEQAQEKEQEQAWALALLRSATGWAKLVWLRRFMNSPRSSRCIPSGRRRIRLLAARLILFRPGPVRMLRPAVPGWPAVAGAKRATSKAASGLRLSWRTGPALIRLGRFWALGLLPCVD